MKLAARLLSLTLPVLLAVPAPAQRQPLTAPITPAAARPEPRAGMVSFQLPSHGALLNAFVYTAAGPGPHPAVILLHGFPGNEKNLDLAQAIRRAGWDVLFFNYRGSWGSPGEFSFTHSIEDTLAAIAYLRDPAHAKALRLDPKRIVLIGHSMGGFMAVEAGAVDSFRADAGHLNPPLAGIGLISAADMAGANSAVPGGIPAPFSSLPRQQQEAILDRIAASLKREGMAPLADCTPEGLAGELAGQSDYLSFAANAGKLAKRPVLIVTSDDGLAPANTVFAQQLRADGDTHVTTTHFPTDHAYSDFRLELTDTVLHWLTTLPLAPPAQP